MAELTIQVKAMVSDAVSSFKELGTQVGGLSKKIEEFASTQKLALASFIGNLASSQATQAIDALKSGLKELFVGSISEAAEAQKALHEFSKSLELNGTYSENAVKKFSDYAQAVQRTTTYTDDAILKNASYIASLTGLDEQGLEKVSKASIELASVLKMDLGSASDLLVKAFNGSTMALERQGIRFQKTGDDAKDFENILKLIQDRWGGKAASELETYSGSVEGLGHAFGELQESLGKLVVDDKKTTGFIKTLTDLFYGLADSINAANDSSARVNEIMGKMYENQYSKPIQPVEGGNLDQISSFSEQLKKKLEEDDNKKSQILTKSQIEKAEKEKKLAEEAQKEAIKREEQRQKAIKDITEKNLQYGLEGEARINAEKKKNLDELIAAYGGIAKVEKLNSEEAITYAANKHAIEMEFAKKLKEEKEKNAKEEENRYKENGRAVERQLQEQEKLKKEQNKQIEGLLGAGTFGSLDTKITNENSLSKEQKSDLSRNKAIGMGAGIASSVLSGASGAQDLLVGGATAVANTIIPGLGQAVGPIIGALSKGPDAVKSFIADFVKSVPVLITNLVQAIPAVGEAIIEQLPILLQSIIDSIPTLITAFTEKIPTVINSLLLQIPKITTEFIINMVKGIPDIVKGIAAGAFNAITDLFNKMNPFSDEGFFGGLFAEGGYVKKVPNGYPNDTFPARLTEGELVIDRSNAAKLEQFLNTQNGNSDILIQILNAVSAPMTVESSVQVNQQTFANIILELSRQNRRLA